MLALTENVTEIVNKLAEEVPEMSGVRIATEPDGQSLSVSPADHAAAGDEVIEQDGATVWVDANAAEAPRRHGAGRRRGRGRQHPVRAGPAGLTYGSRSPGSARVWGSLLERCFRLALTRRNPSGGPWLKHVTSMATHWPSGLEPPPGPEMPLAASAVDQTTAALDLKGESHGQGSDLSRGEGSADRDCRRTAHCEDPDHDLSRSGPTFRAPPIVVVVKEDAPRHAHAHGGGDAHQRPTRAPCASATIRGSGAVPNRALRLPRT